MTAPATIEQAVTEALGRLVNPLAPSVIAVGADVVDIVAFTHNARIGGTRWLAKVFTDSELVVASGCADKLATSFAGKEAVAKVLQTGFRGVSPRDIEVIRAPHGAPRIRLHGRAEEVASRAGITAVPVSLTRDGDVALAVALGVGDGSRTSHEEELA